MDQFFRPSSDQPHTGYACIGRVRRWCGHVHHSFGAAVRCREKDRRDCQRHGGYSDRTIMRIVDAEVRDSVPYKIDPCTGEAVRL